MLAEHASFREHLHWHQLLGRSRQVDVTSLKAMKALVWSYLLDALQLRIVGRAVGIVEVLGSTNWISKHRQLVARKLQTFLLG